MTTSEVTVSAPTGPAPHLRAADDDRAAVADVLGAHMSAGRLTVAEYDERLGSAWAARTHGELAGLTTDLPPLAPAPPAPATTAAATADERTDAAAAHGCIGGPNLQVAVRNWVVTALIVWAVYLGGGVGDGDWAFPWPLWVVGPWGAVLLAQLLRRRTAAPSTR